MQRKVTHRLVIVLGLLLGALFAGQWVRAQFVHEWFRWLTPRTVTFAELREPKQAARAYVIELNGYGVALKQFDCWMYPSDAFGFAVLRASPNGVRWTQQPLRLGRLGFSGSRGSVDSSPFVVVPYWAVCAIGTMPLVVRLLRERRRRRLADTLHCRACGYDLRATPQRCPECGRATPIGINKEPAATTTPAAGIS